MSITDELREYASTRLSPNKGMLLTIADRIDAEHERELEKARGKGMCDTLEVLETGWIELPRDANGEYIHEHDKVDWRDHAGTWHENATVVAVCNDGCYVMDGTVFHVHKSDIRHHHAPTVEDVLREFGERYCDTVTDSDDEKTLFAEYAAKLRLRGDEE